LFSPATTVPFSGKSFRLGADVVDENAGTVTLPDGDLPREAEIGFGSVNGDSPVLQRIIEEDYAAIESQRRELIKRAESCAFIGGGWLAVIEVGKYTNEVRNDVDDFMLHAASLASSFSSDKCNPKVQDRAFAVIEVERHFRKMQNNLVPFLPQDPFQ